MTLDRFPTDEALISQCDVDTYRASGPGGQKRNKTDSGVRLRHRPSGLMVIAVESRSQPENKARALRRLRKVLALRLRQAVEGEGAPPAVEACLDKRGRLNVGQRDARYLPAAAVVLDVFVVCGASVSATAARLGLTTGNLSSFLTDDEELFVETNRLRGTFGLKPLGRR